ncbi:hypothetical protein IOD14_11225 [Streptomyces sp. A2-16]|nr:hypothetical protein [Streptomyces sp. A2-16]QUC57317.1 hypothetical protein IOD14_11225 [Streptomyces sp. A2-16]
MGCSRSFVDCGFVGRGFVGCGFVDCGFVVSGRARAAEPRRDTVQRL